MKKKPDENNKLQRRRFERIEITSTASLTVFSELSPTVKMEGTVVNISQGGVGLCLKEIIHPDTRIEVELTFIDTEGNKCVESIQGQVMWKKVIKPHVLIGVHFGSLDEEAHPGLVRSLKAQTEWMVTDKSQL